MSMEKINQIRKCLIESFGNECSLCGYNKYKNSLEFHHINSDLKSGTISSMIKRCRWNDLRAELNNCVLICCNCHMDIHRNPINKKLIFKGYDETLIPKRNCTICGSLYVSPKSLTCSADCFKYKVLMRNLALSIQKKILKSEELKHQNSNKQIIVCGKWYDVDSLRWPTVYKTKGL